MVESRKATPFCKRGVFLIRLNVEPSARNIQNIAVGIDPGSKKEGFTVKSETHTFLNIQATAVTHVRFRVETRRLLRRSRRQRNAPYRQHRPNRRGRGLAPSTRARWGWKLRIATWLTNLYPINAFVIEDIQAPTMKGGRKWNSVFSPLETGKSWFYEQIGKLGRVDLKQGYDTYELRVGLGLKKTSNKMASVFSAHCVDSWVLANWFVGGHDRPDNERLLILESIPSHRRNLHTTVAIRGGFRKRRGGTMSGGLKKGQLARHVKYGLCYIGGHSSIGISLCDVKTGKRLCRTGRVGDLQPLAYNSWRFWVVNGQEVKR